MYSFTCEGMFCGEFGVGILRSENHISNSGYFTLRVFYIGGIFLVGIILSEHFPHGDFSEVVFSE